ncbi:hypothetical protein [Mycolicibacterium iranicum]|uniref:hypothetical protein n=1 Tax=Mycolicibacterium iranicum TaxID=912594 RepID=UPI002286847E|nr:hypothetical protein [Mycolicibacterium iranicum]
MESSFHFLDANASDLLDDVLSRRDPALHERVRQSGTVSASDAELIMAALNEELTNNLDEDWEPTDYGRTVSAVMAAFNRTRIAEWP